jgi:hypothetical protein
MGTMGVPIYGDTPEEKAHKRSERARRRAEKRIKEYQEKGYLTKD